MQFLKWAFFPGLASSKWVLRRGTINKQFLKVRHKGRDKPISRGPYYVLSRRQGGKTVSQRLSSPEALKQAQKDVETHKRFVALCKQFEELTERLGQIQRESDDLRQGKNGRARGRAGPRGKTPARAGRPGTAGGPGGLGNGVTGSGSERGCEGPGDSDRGHRLRPTARGGALPLVARECEAKV